MTEIPGSATHKESNIWDAIIVGAGISGLWLANRLRNVGKSVLIIEKSAGLGGRLATRRSGTAAFDHGAQFLKKWTAPSNKFMPWFASLPSSTSIWFTDDKADYLTFPQGMTAWPKYLAEGHAILKSERVLKLQDDGVTIQVHTDKNSYQAHEVFISSPVPQTIELLNASEIRFPDELKAITYAMAVVGLFQVNLGKAATAPFHYLQDVSAEIFSMSQQDSKSVSPVPAFTVTMTPAWSAEHFDKVDSETIHLVQQMAQNFFASRWGENQCTIVHAELKKWRYSHPLSIYKKPYERVGRHQNIILLGDAFGGPSINGALESAQSIELAPST